MPIAAASFVSFPWKNGRGVTTDIAAAYRPGSAPGDWVGTIWRLGRTSIPVPGPFSDLAGFDRCQLVLRGRGLHLRGPGGFERTLAFPDNPVRYPGEGPIEADLADGPVEVLNLIARRTHAEIDLGVPRIGAPQMLRAGTHILYAPSERACVKTGAGAYSIEPGDALRLDAANAFELLATSGRLMCASIFPR
jgi:environmental stress-induced protein Ves